MQTDSAAGVGRASQSNDIDGETFEDALRWCRENRATVTFFVNGMVTITWVGGRINADTFLDGIMDIMDGPAEDTDANR